MLAYTVNFREVKVKVQSQNRGTENLPIVIETWLPKVSY